MTNQLNTMRLEATWQRVQDKATKHLAKHTLEDLLEIGGLDKDSLLEANPSIGAICIALVNVIVAHQIPVKVYHVKTTKAYGKQRYQLNYGFGIATAYSRSIFNPLGGTRKYQITTREMGILDEWQHGAGDLFGIECFEMTLALNSKGNAEILSISKGDIMKYPKWQEIARIHAKRYKQEQIEKARPAKEACSKALSEFLQEMEIIEDPLPLEQDSYAIDNYVFYVEYIGIRKEIRVRDINASSDEMSYGQNFSIAEMPIQDIAFTSSRLVEALEKVDKWRERHTKPETIELSVDSAAYRLLEALEGYIQDSEIPF